MIELVQTRERFDELRPYNSRALPEKDYPTSYPVILVAFEAGGGLMGEHIAMKLVYPPQGSNAADYLAGFEAGWYLAARFC